MDSHQSLTTRQLHQSNLDALFTYSFTAAWVIGILWLSQCCRRWQNTAGLQTPLPVGGEVERETRREKRKAKVQARKEFLETALPTRPYQGSVRDTWRDVSDEDQEKESCSICLLEYRRRDILTKSNRHDGGECLHVYHRDCLMMWLIKNKYCPQCRTIYLNEDMEGICRRDPEQQEEDVEYARAIESSGTRSTDSRNRNETLVEEVGTQPQQQEEEGGGGDGGDDSAPSITSNNV